MRLLASASALLLVPRVLGQVSRPDKRGLVYVPNPNHPSDDNIWTTSSSDLTWYYNYRSSPSPSYANNPKLQFVPMLWGLPDSTTNFTFLNDVQAQLDSGANVSHILTFNEPDGTGSTGGSAISADLAAATWIREVEPLKAKGVKLGAPAVTGSPGGFVWLQNFFTACNGNCSADFIPIHWYGNFEGMASHIGQVRATYMNMSIWVTEYADANADLTDSQSFVNTTSSYMDRIDYVVRYSYFGSFRSDISNVGPNAAMLDKNGALTDIGSWYLGGVATGNIPSEAGRNAIFAGSSLMAVVAIFFFLA